MVIASGAVDRSHLSPFAPLSESPSSSFFSQDLVPTEVSNKYLACFFFSPSLLRLIMQNQCIYMLSLPPSHPMSSLRRGKLDSGNHQSQWSITKVRDLLHLKKYIYSWLLFHFIWLLLLAWCKLSVRPFFFFPPPSLISSCIIEPCKMYGPFYTCCW